MRLTLKMFIEAEMKRRELSMRAFAEMVGVTHATISRLTTEPDADPSLKTVVKLARATKTDLCALVGLLYPDEAQPADVDLEGRLFLQKYRELSEDVREFLLKSIFGV